MKKKWIVPLTVNFGERVGTAEVFTDASGIKVTAIIDEPINEDVLNRVAGLMPEPTLSISIQPPAVLPDIPRDALASPTWDDYYGDYYF